MRFQGRIASWKDDKGFGFITPNGGGKQVFVHVSAFRNRQRRPEGDELVTYELAVDEKGRGQAMQVAFVGEPARGDGKFVSAWLPTFFAAGFLAFLAATVMAGKLPLAIPGVYLTASVLAFVTYAIDKSAAQTISGESLRTHCTCWACSADGRARWPPRRCFATNRARHPSRGCSGLPLYSVVVRSAGCSRPREARRFVPSWERSEKSVAAIRRVSSPLPAGERAG